MISRPVEQVAFSLYFPNEQEPKPFATVWGGGGGGGLITLGKCKLYNNNIES